MKDRLTTDRIRQVHVSLKHSKSEFENWAKNLYITTERVLVKFGKNIIDRQIIQLRLSNAMIDLYGMIAVLSRVDSLIEAKGEENCQREIRMCNTFCEQAWRRIRRNILMVDKNVDGDMLDIADHIIDQKKYPWTLAI